MLEARRRGELSLWLVWRVRVLPGWLPLETSTEGFHSSSLPPTPPTVLHYVILSLSLHLPCYFYSSPSLLYTYAVHPAPPPPVLTLPSAPASRPRAGGHGFGGKTVRLSFVPSVLTAALGVLGYFLAVLISVVRAVFFY